MSLIPKFKMDQINSKRELDLMFMKHYAPNRCLYIKVATLRTGLGSAKFEAPSCNTFRDIINTNFQSPNLQSEIIKKKKKTFFLDFHQLSYSLSSISSPSLKLLAVIVFEIS